MATRCTAAGAQQGPVQSWITTTDEQGIVPGLKKRDRWDAALDKLSHGDHYLLVLANRARPSRKGLKYKFKLLIVALGFLLFAALDMYFRRWMRDH
jgi:hypothetical protein